MREQLQQLLHSKWFLVAGAAVVGVGGYVLYQRKKGGSSTSTGTATATGTAGVAGLGSFDTTSTDLNAALSNLETSNAGVLSDYGKQLTDAIAALQQVPTNSGTGIPTTGGVTTLPAGGTATTLPAISPAPTVNKSAPQFITVAKYTTKSPVWNSTLSGIAKHYGTSVSSLLKLNPQVTNPNIIHTGAAIRVK